MNKIVRALIEDASDYDTDEGAMYGGEPVVIPEDLVALVVLECVKVCKENNLFVAADRIKKHFGVN